MNNNLKKQSSCEARLYNLTQYFSPFFLMGYRLQRTQASGLSTAFFHPTRHTFVTEKKNSVFQEDARKKVFGR